MGAIVQARYIFFKYIFYFRTKIDDFHVDCCVRRNVFEINDVLFVSEAMHGLDLVIHHFFLRL